MLSDEGFGLDEFALKVHLWQPQMETIDEGLDLIERGTRVAHNELRGGGLIESAGTFWERDAFSFEQLSGSGTIW